MIEILIALSLFFRQAGQYLGSDRASTITLGGNLDPFFLLGFVGVYYILKTKQVRYFLKWTSPFIVLGIVQITFLPDILYIDWFVNLTKILLCIATFLFVKDNYQKIRLEKVALIFTLLLAVTTLAAVVVGPNEVLWTLNDGVNKFDLTRLRLFFLEPSELGFTIVIVMMVLLNSLIHTAKTSKAKLIYLVALAANGIALYLAKPLGAIAIGAVALVVFLLYHLLINNPSRAKRIVACSIVAVVAIASILVFAFPSVLKSIDNSMAQRAARVIEGGDGSVNYRVQYSAYIALDTVTKNPLLGAGYGNTSSPAFQKQYASIGFVTSVVSSFFGFITEAGLLGVAVVVRIISRLIYRGFASRSAMFASLVVFLVLYQFFGSHFTNPLVWALYGYIIAASLQKRKGMYEKNRNNHIS